MLSGANGAEAGNYIAKTSIQSHLRMKRKIIIRAKTMGLIVWILSREKTLDDNVYFDLVSRAENWGFDTSKLIRVEQNK